MLVTVPSVDVMGFWVFHWLVHVMVWNSAGYPGADTVKLCGPLRFSVHGAVLVFLRALRLQHRIKWAARSRVMLGSGWSG